MSKFIVSALIMLLVVSWGVISLPLTTQAAIGSNDSNKTTIWQAMRGGGLTEIGENVYGSEEAPDLRLVVSNVIRRVLEVLGIVFLVLVVYAGILWMTAGGNTEQIDRAKAFLRNAAIGLAITLAAYAITLFVVDILLTATNSGS